MWLCPGLRGKSECPGKEPFCTFCASMSSLALPLNQVRCLMTRPWTQHGGQCILPPALTTPRTLSMVFLPMASHQAPNLLMPASPDTGQQAGEPWASSQACAFLYPLQVGHRLCWQKLVQLLLTSKESTHSKISISSKKLKMGNRF